MKALLRKIRQILRDRKTRRIFTRLVSTVAAIVVFVTTYALVLPAITMESEAACGIEAHQHDQSCYTDVLVCELPEGPGHVHDESCYSTKQKQVCQIEEHVHDSDCYDRNGKLICEKDEHQHGEDCFEEVRELVCEIPESPGHQHDDSCFQKVLTCGREVHTHSTACYRADTASQAATEAIAVASTESAAAAATGNGLVDNLNDPVENGEPETSLDSSIENNVIEGNLDASPDYSEPGSDLNLLTNEVDKDEPGAWTSTEATADATAASTGSGAGVTGSTAAATGLSTGGTAATAAPAGATDTMSAAAGYVPVLDELNFDTLLNKHTGIYYSRFAGTDSAVDNETNGADAAKNTGEPQEEVTWNRIDKHTELKESDNLRLYLAYTIPAGSLNETNQTARYSLPKNIHLTDEQVDEINATVNGIAGQYVSYDTLEILDQEMYGKYLGIEAVEGTRTPADDLDEYLANNEGQEFISATVKVENVFDENTGLLKAQDLVFTFAPYTIQKNQHQYDSEGKPTKAGEEVNGWLAIDISTEQIDWEKADDETKTADIIFVEKDKKSDLKEIRTELRLVETEADSDADTNAGNAADGVSSDPAATDSKQDGTNDSEAAAGESDKAEKEQVSYPSVSFDDSITVAGGSLSTDTDEASGDAGMAAETELTVHVEADEDTFPEGTTMVLSAVSDEQMTAVVEAVEGAVDAPKTMGFHAVDISFRDVEGNEIEPLKPIRVSMTSDAIKRAFEDESTAPVVVHVSGPSADQDAADENTDDGGSTDAADADEAEGADSQPILDSSESTDEQVSGSDLETTPEANIIEIDTGTKENNGDTLTFDADAFSVYAIVYTVDFHYEINGKMYEFSIPGGGFVSLEHVVEVLGIASADENTENGAENTENSAENGNDFVGEVLSGVDESSENGEGGDEEAADTESSSSLESTAYEDAIKLNEFEVSEATKKFVANVASVEFSSPELVWVGKVDEEATVGGLKEANGLKVEYSANLTEEQIAEINAQTVEPGDWALISVQPFTSEESLTVTMKNGNHWTVKVTDDQKTSVEALENNEQYILYIKRDNQYYAIDGEGKTVLVPGKDLDALDSEYLWNRTPWRQYWWQQYDKHNAQWENGGNSLDVYYTKEGTLPPNYGNNNENKEYPIQDTSLGWDPITKLSETSDGGFYFYDLNDPVYLTYIDGHVRAVDVRSYRNKYHQDPPGAIPIYIYKQNKTYTLEVDVNNNDYGYVTYKSTPNETTSASNQKLHLATAKNEDDTKDMQYELVAVPREGYRFVGWTEVKEDWESSNIYVWYARSFNGKSTDATIKPALSGNTKLRAVFEFEKKYKLIVKTADPMMGHVSGTDNEGNVITQADKSDRFDSISTVVISGTATNAYALKAEREPTYRFVKWILAKSDGTPIREYTTETLAANSVNLSQNDMIQDDDGEDTCFLLTAMYEKMEDDEIQKYDIDWLLKNWQDGLTGDLVDVDKTAHVVDYANRIYEIDLKASSRKHLAIPSVTLDIITDTSRSMYFPANLKSVGNTNGDLVRWVSENGSDHSKVYYVISAVPGSDETATIYAIYNEDKTNMNPSSPWKYVDSSYYYYDRATPNNIWPQNVNYNTVSGNTLKYASSSTNPGQGAAAAKDRLLTGEVYTSSTPPLSYRNHYNKSMGDEYWSRLDYLFKAVLVASRTVKTIDSTAAIHLTTFNNVSTNEGYIYSKDQKLDDVTEEAIYNKLAGIDLSGGTRQNNGMYTARTGTDQDRGDPNTTDPPTINSAYYNIQNDDTHTPFAILITDGAPNNVTWDQVRGQATALKGLKNKNDENLILMTLGLGSAHVGTNKDKFDALSTDYIGPDADNEYAENANNGQQIVDAITGLVEKMVKQADLFGTATDVLDKSFYPVTRDGDPIQPNVMYDTDGQPLQTKPGEHEEIPYCIWTVDDYGQWTVTYYNQTFIFPNLDENGKPTEPSWERSFYVKSKENFLGGNMIETNQSCTVTAKGAFLKEDTNPQRDYRELDESVSVSPKTPHVNVKQLTLDEHNTAWKIYTKTGVKPIDQIKELYDNIQVTELVEKSTEERVTVENEMIKSKDYKLPEPEDDKEPQTFFLKDILGEIDWDTLMQDGSLQLDYPGYGHNPGVIRLTLSKTGSKADYGNHLVTTKEEYTLTAQYRPYTVEEMFTRDNRADDKDDKQYHTPPEQSPGDPISNGKPSVNNHIIEVFSRSLGLTKANEDYKQGLAGAVFELYRPATDEEIVAGGDDIKTFDGDAGKYVLQQEMNVDDNGVVFFTAVDLLVNPETTYYIVEKTAPTGYTKSDTPVPMKLRIADQYTTVPLNAGEDPVSSTTKPDNGLYNWNQTAKLWMVIDGSDVIRTTGDYDPDDPTKVLTNEPITPSSESETMYYRWRNEPIGVDIIIHKVDEKEAPLAGAVFKLMNGSSVVEISTSGTGVIVEPKISGETVTIEDNTFTIPESGVTIKKLPTSDNEYEVVEVSPPPNGYVITNNTPVTFKVTAGQITDMVTTAGVEYKEDGNDFIIPNTPGAALPSAGGPGTWLLTILGSILILGAGILLWRRQRLI